MSSLPAVLKKALVRRLHPRTVNPIRTRPTALSRVLERLEDRITPDAKVFTDASLTVQVGAPYTGATAILDAANDVSTLDGYYVVADTANAPLGGYTPGTITKSLTI